MVTRKKAAAQARDQGAPAQGAPGQTTPQDAPGRPQGAPRPAPGPDTPPAQADAASARPLPGAPRNYQPETRTIEQARAELADSGAFPWPYPGPVHGIQGFSKLAGWAQQEKLGGEKEPADILGDDENALLVLITQAKQLGQCDPVQNALIAVHEEFGKFYLRAVKLPDDGYLMGIIDEKGATYCACEYYDSMDDLRDAWRDWTAILNKELEK